MSEISHPKRRPPREDTGAPVSIPSPGADELVAKARAGDLDAFAGLFKLTLPIVYGHLYRRSGNAALAEDLASETYLRAIRSIRTFEGESRDFLAWIVRISRNLFLDHVKSGRVRWETAVEEMPVVVSASDPESEAVARVEAADVRRALGRLTAEQQEVVYLRFIEGLPIADVAKIVGRAEGAVKALQFRALRTLARILREEGAIARGEPGAEP